MEKLNIEIYNRSFKYCLTLGTTPLQEYQQNNHESWLNSSDGESQVSHLQKEKCPTSVIKKFKKHESVNLIRLKQTAKRNTMEPDLKGKTAEAVQRAEKNFALHLPMLVEETARDVKPLNAISALESNQIESILCRYRPHRNHLSTRFGLLFYNDKVVIPEAMRTTVVAMLHHGHAAVDKKSKAAESFWWPGLYSEIQEKSENCPSCRAAGKNLRTLLPTTEINRLETLTEPNQEIQLDFAGPIKSETRGDVYILVAVDRFVSASGPPHRSVRIRTVGP